MEFPQKMQHRRPDVAASVRHVRAFQEAYFGWAAPIESPKSEYFTGFEASDNYASGYVGAGYALGKAGLYEPGFRLRAVGAYGRYRYDGALLPHRASHHQAVCRHRGRGPAY